MSADHVTRLPRVGRHPPLSGRDRRHYAREAARAPQTYIDMMLDAERKRAEAARAAKEADRLECEAWCGALLFGLEVVTSPTIAQALNAGFDGIEIQCQRCRRISVVSLAKIKRSPDTELWKLEPSLICQPCRDDLEALKPKRGFRSRTQALITGLHLAKRETDPPDEPPSSPAKVAL